MEKKFLDTEDTILVVDDEQNILRSLQRELLDMPYNLLTASSAEMALELLKANTVSVIISDQRMPGVCGTELLTEVRKKYPDTVRVLLTAFSDMQDIIDSVNKGGIYKFLLKPWDTNELKKAIADSVDQYRIAKNQISRKQSVQDASTQGGLKTVSEHPEIML